MKYFNVNGKRSSLLAKGITILALSVTLQGAEGCRGWNKRGAAYYVAMTPSETFSDKLEEKFAKGSTAIFKDETGRSLLYILVEKRKDDKLSIFLQRCNDHIKYRQSSDPGFNENFIEALSAIDPNSKMTPLGAAIATKNKDIFHALINQKDININCAGDNTRRNPTTLLSALAMKQRNMVSILLAKDGIDITTIDPSSGNTTIHRAIKNEWDGVAKDLIKRINTSENPALLCQQNKEGNTPLHLAIQYKLPDVQSKLISLIDKDQLWIKNNKGQTPVDMAIEANQKWVIDVLKEASLEKLCKENKNGETCLHVAARLHRQDIFQAILESIIEKSDKNNAIAELHKKTKQEKSTWACIILSELGAQPIGRKRNIQMFKDTLTLVTNKPEETDWGSILNDIDNLEKKGALKFGISKDYAKELREAVASIKNQTKVS